MTTAMEPGRLSALAGQLGASLRSLAPVLAEYHAALVAAGFERPEALALVRDYQTWLLAGGAESPPAGSPSV